MEIAAHEGSLTAKTCSPLETEAVGKALGGLLGPGDVVGLVGDLGTGKTCFTRGIAAGMGLDASVPVLSPSFTILNEHPGTVALYHFDFYRLEAAPVDLDVEWREYFFGQGVAVVEWAEKVADFLPQDRITVEFSFMDDDLREIRLKGTGARFERVVTECRRVLDSVSR